MISQRICTLHDSCFAVVEVNGWADIGRLFQLNKNIILFNLVVSPLLTPSVDCHSEVPLFALFFGFGGELHFVNKMMSC